MGAYFAYPIYGAWSLTTGFARDSSKLTRFVQGYDRSVLEYYAQYGKRAQDYLDTTENSVSMYLTRDTRNHGMIPSAGSKITMGSKISGLGGDLAYSRITAEGAYYQRLFWKAIMKVKSSAVLLVESPNEPIPFDQRLLLGGVSSVRGYQFGQIGPADRYGHIIGGDRSIFGNLECLFPLVESLQLNGVAFFDVGSAWNVADSPLPENVRAGTGVGIRWVSPMGPIRIEYGWKVDPRPGETAGEFAFAMGQLF
jgi:outer membrane protein insertion porin family